MAHRTFRLSISPDDAPAVRRVIDFDGRNTLDDVHLMMHRTLSVGDDDHLYAFFLSGQYWDKATEYVDPRTDGQRADQALLFRSKLRPGQQFVYVYDFGAEHRYTLTVVSVTETAAPLPSPILVESVGEPPPLDLAWDESDEGENGDGETDPALAEPFKLAAAVEEASRVLDEALDLSSEDEQEGTEQTRPLWRALGEAALALARGLAGDLQLLSAVDRKFDLLGSLLDLPARLSVAGETELAVAIAEALRFCALDDMNGEVALAYARAGDRERALARVLSNLETAETPFIAENKAGDVYRELAEADAAEAYYRRALALAPTTSARRELTLRIASLLIDTGREQEAAALVSQPRAGVGKPAKGTATQLPSVGRNDPCPCGSGKKYKKCHGA